MNSKSKMAYLVIGSEGSGTKLFTQILINAGCIGDAGIWQRWDTEPVEGRPIVYRKSVPHGEKYPDIYGIIDMLRTNGYQVCVFITTRDWYAMIQSRLKEGIVNEAVTISRIEKSYIYIFEHIARSNVPYALISYEAITGRGIAYVEKMLQHFGLEAKTMPEIKNGNDKYYERDKE